MGKMKDLVIDQLNEPLRITSLEQLHAWNNNPTEKAPILMEWILDYIIDECPKKYKDFLELYDAFVRFTFICEHLSKKEASERVNENLLYWYSRASKNSKLFKLYFNKALVSNFGFNM